MARWSYYNEIDPYAAEWLCNLIKAGLIADGEVDTRSIVDVRADDIRSFAQCHFFAGVGVWSHALRRGGFRDWQNVWTGSCPCQPWSVQGHREGAGDKKQRHLWPHFFRLIAERRPAIVFGEQVADGGGLEWLDIVHADLERAGYAVGSADTCAAGFGAPHRRQRLYFVAERDELDSSCLALALERRSVHSLADAEGYEQRWLRIRESSGEIEARGRRATDIVPIGDRDALNGFWGNADWVRCTDEKWRPIEPGTVALVDGASAGVVGDGAVEKDVAEMLRGYGNAIVAEQATAFIRSVHPRHYTMSVFTNDLRMMHGVPIVPANDEDYREVA